MTKLPKPPDTHHLTYRAALRARRRWLNSLRGRDAYVHKGGRLRYFVSYIDYAPPPRDPEQQALKDAQGYLADLSLVMGRFSLCPNPHDYHTAINLAAHLVAALTAGDNHRRFAEAKGLNRPSALMYKQKLERAA